MNELQKVESSNPFQQIEINGMKFEVDLREAKRIDTFKIGDPLKVLIKGYGDEWKQHHGVIVDFTEYVNRPSITIAYVDVNYSEAKIIFKEINQDTNIEDIDIAPCNPFAIEIDKVEIISYMDRDIEKRKEEIRQIEHKKRLFEKHFSKYFKDVINNKE